MLPKTKRGLVGWLLRHLKHSPCVGCGGADLSCSDCNGYDRIYYLTNRDYDKIDGERVKK